MLVITRKVGQRVFVGDNIVLTVSRILPDGRVRIGIEAPREVVVTREELRPQGGGSCSESGQSNSSASAASR